MHLIQAVSISIDQIAIMLGKHRNLVSVASRELQRKGLIGHNHGRITMLDPQGLEAVSCECHRIVKEWTAEPLYAFPD
ncbi:MAG: helix-turn-helix domain-containing protein [Pyrinomonadaceae bacterium]